VLRLQALRVLGMLEVARMELAARTRRAPAVRIREHRSTQAVIDRLASTRGVNVVPPPRHHPGLLRVERLLARDRAAVERRFDEALARIRQDVFDARPDGWSLAVGTFFAVCRPGMFRTLEEVVRTWWHLDRYRPVMLVEHDWFQPDNHAAWSWARERQVPFTVFLHGEGGVLNGQFQFRSLHAEQVYCWSDWSRSLTENLAGPGVKAVIRTGNPAYDALAPSQLPAKPVRVRRVLAALSAYTGVWADEEVRSWQAVARMVTDLPELRWKIRGHRVSALGDGFETLFGALPVEMPDRYAESFFQATEGCDVVLTNLSTVRTDAIALGKLLVVWNDLGIHDPLNDRPGMVVVNSEAELRTLLSRLAREPALYASLLEGQIAGCERQLLPSAAVEALAERIRSTVRAAAA
jgi:hypothetical protein